jgi:hypothetical protein
MTCTKSTAMAVGLFAMAAWLTFPSRAEAKGGHSCTSNPPGVLKQHQDLDDLIIKGTLGADGQITPLDCVVRAGTYKFRNVHVLKGATLRFTDAKIDFWAANILVENGGSLVAGVEPNGDVKPIGASGGVMTIHLYGTDLTGQNPAKRGKGITCLGPADGAGEQSSDPERCGVPEGIWNNGSFQGDTFYAYHPLPFDDADHQGYFGYKVLAVSYGGTLRLFGKKGALGSSDTQCKPTAADSTGRSWTRLAKTAKVGESSITVVNPNWDPNTRKGCGLDWVAGDDIVITTTDYLPGHSEQRKITSTPTDNGDGTITLGFDKALTYSHNGTRYSLTAKLTDEERKHFDKLGLDADLVKNGTETRAAVGLLTRSIRIVSEGDTATCSQETCFPAESTGYFFGGHLIARQGFASFQVQGVEFYQMGQGGRLGHYPIHFHHARKTPANTFVMDSSIHDSMTRWIVLHGTHGVTLARNVGYKSIGHGFYLEDGTEIENKLLANLGVFARAAVDNPQNPRKVPGILAAPDLHGPPGDDFPFRSDYNNPTVFWIMNGWNDFQHNMAAGAGTCGTCYWLVPGFNSGMSRGMQWDSYASMQSNEGRAGMTPLKSFVGNSCSSAMMAFQTVGNTAPCNGVQVAGTNGDFPTLPPIKNPLAASSGPGGDDYYPRVVANGSRFATQCGGGDCSSSPPRCGATAQGPPNPECMATVLDKFTTSFNWAQFTVASIWLRNQWYLVTDSVITDVQNAGLTMVTGGGYHASDVVPGHWALARKSVFIGHTQEDNPFASNGGPFNPKGLQCAEDKNGSRPGNYCLSVAEGVSHQITNFGMYQRLFSVYDGPAFQDSNAYLNIKTRTIDDCTPRVDGKVGQCLTQRGAENSAWVAGFVQGLAKSEDGKTCYMPNAAIGWKQPNGFYYPPAFHSTNLFFKDVDVRHFVITPLFKEGTLDVDFDRVAQEYCRFNPSLFDGFTAIDRQTVLNDDDGTLTGFKKTTVINLDEFFAAPVDAIECRSDNTSRTSPYGYVTTVLYPKCATTGTCLALTPEWKTDCTNEQCDGVIVFRQDEMPKADRGVARSIRMMGQNTGQRSTLTANHGTYYLDTARLSSSSRFTKNETYYLFLIFAKADTEQAYRFFVGQNTDFDPASIQMIQANIDPNPVKFQNLQPLPAGRAKWFDKAKGVVEVTLNVSDFPGVAKKYQDVREKKCQPATYCTWNAAANNGQGDCEDKSPRAGAAKDAVCRWAVADPDCPDGGCIGIVFTLPDKFTTLENSDSVRPAAACIPKTDKNWDVPLDLASDGICPRQALVPNGDGLPEDFCQ